MLVVKTSVKPSGVEGLGLFAAEDITKGTTIWKFDPRFDVYFSLEEVEKMPLLQQELIKHFGTMSKRSGKYIYSIDDSRFTNHSSKNDNQEFFVLPGDIEFSGVAAKDIKAGEEILVNYQDFDAVDAISQEEYLNN